MITIKQSKILCSIIIVLLLLSGYTFHVLFVPVTGPLTSAAPTIDGVIDATEWQDAEITDTVIGGYPVKIYVMNDFSSIYIALEVTDPNPCNGLILLFDDDDDNGIPDDGALYNALTHTYHDTNAILVDDAHTDGIIDFSFSAGKNLFEFSKPFGSGDPADFMVDLLSLQLKMYIIYVPSGGGFFSLGWMNINIEIPCTTIIQNIRQPDQVKVGQMTYITVDVKYELLPPGTMLIIEVTDTDSGDVQDFHQTVSDNGTITHTFEFTAPAAPTDPWIFTVTADSFFCFDSETVEIEVKDDLGIAPEVEGICIWDGPPPPDYHLVSNTVEIPIEVKYAVTYDAWIHVGIYDETGALISTAEFDETVSGVGTNDYIFEVNTPAVDTVWNLKASLYYGHVAGVDSVHEECDEWPFTIIITSGVPGGEGVKIMDVNSPAEVNSSAEVSIDVLVEYQLPTADTKYRVNILDAGSGLVIKTSEEKSWPAPAWGFTTFNFDGIYAPYVPVDTTFTLVAVAEYQKPGEDWQILDPEGIREFEIRVLGVALSPGELPEGVEIPPLPLPPDLLPPPPPEFDFALAVTPNTQETTLGQMVKYTITVSSTANASQPVMLGISGYPLGASVDIQPLAGNPTYTSTLTVTLGTSVQPGTYTMTVNATGRGKSHSQTASLVVKSPPDFTLSLSEPEIRIARGETATLDATVQPLHGFNTPVNLALKSVSAGVTVNFNPVSGTPSLTSRIDIRVDSSVTPGTYPVVIAATGSAEKTAQIILNVEAPRQEPAGKQQAFPYGLLTIIVLLILAATLLVARRRRGAKPKPPAAPPRFCIECGAPVPADAAHCPKCGVKQP